MLTQDDIDLILKHGSKKDLAALASYLENPLWSFVPRPDNEEKHDQQAGFIDSQFPGISVLLGGNGSAKTWSGGIKTARLLLNRLPPRPRTEFWCLSQNFEMASQNMWGNTLGQFITDDYIESVKWYNMGLRQPSAVVMKPSANGNRWVVVFKSCESGERKLMGGNVMAFGLMSSFCIPYYSR